MYYVVQNISITYSLHIIENLYPLSNTRKLLKFFSGEAVYGALMAGWRQCMTMSKFNKISILNMENMYTLIKTQ